MSIKLSSEFVNFDLYSYFYSLVRQIPEGKITTYGALADALGDRVAARACGYMSSINPDPEEIPCYKVVRSDGTVGKYTHFLGTEDKIRKLNEDGVETVGERIIDFEKLVFTDFDSDYPLKKMKEEQIDLSSKVVLEDDYDPLTLGAIDVSYNDYFGYASFIVKENDGYTETNYKDSIRFPYIPGYLAYREYKFIEKLAQDFKGLLLIDGNGILHPRRFGLASFTGVLLDSATIGIAKSLLLGKENNGWIEDNSTRLGYRLNRKTIISPGNRISLESSVNEIRRLFDDRYPEILKIADKNTVKLRNSFHE